MRDFGQTPEPSGASSKKRVKKLVFVVQKHHASHLHYDFRLEMEGVLKSWAIPKGPSYDPSVRRLAMMTEDHPYDYKDFERVIPEGNYGAGNVIVWDNGTWEFLGPGEDPVKALKAGKLTFVMKGKKLIGEWALVRLNKPGRGNEWLLLKHRDEFAAPNFDVTVEAPRSIFSNMDVDELVSQRTWKSNRSASSTRKAPTLADALTKDRSERKPRKKSSAKSATKKSAAKKSPVRKQSTVKKSAATPAKKRTKAAGGTARKAARPAARKRSGAK
jgi:bifunctional non-homologous end joining protein LigD